MAAQPQANDHLVLICGKSGAGKSASLRNLPNPTGVAYLNCESAKKLPFASKFKQIVITDPYTVYEAFEQAEKTKDIHTIVVDSLTFLMDMFESVHVLPAADTMKGWSQYQQFFKNLMQQYVAASTKNVIFTGHVETIYNETAMAMETKIPVKGALKKNGLESFFSCVVMARKMVLRDLEGYKNALLNITPQEEALGFKHVFQTQVTKEMVNSRIRGPMGLWTPEETYIDNDAQLLMERLHQYYA